MFILRRALVMRVHLVLAAFFLPVGLGLLVTGALYTLGIEGHSTKRVLTAETGQPLRTDRASLRIIAEQQLQAAGIDSPKGAERLRHKNGRPYLYWRDLRYSVKVKPLTPTRAQVEVQERDWLSRLMRIHKGDAGSLFKAVTVAWAAALLLLFASGSYLAVKVPTLRRTLLISMGLGTLSVVTLIVLA